MQDGNATELADVTVKEHTHAMVNNKCACGLSCTHKNTEGASTIGKDGKCTACGTQFAAGIGETYYTDVKSALNAATDGQTIKLLANEMLPSDTYVSKTPHAGFGRTQSERIQLECRRSYGHEPGSHRQPDGH